MKLFAVCTAAAGTLVAGLASAEVESTSRSMTFEQCQAVQSSTITQLNVPDSDIEPVVNTSILTITRVYTADGSILISCSDPDQKMVITKSSKGR